MAHLYCPGSELYSVLALIGSGISQQYAVSQAVAQRRISLYISQLEVSDQCFTCSDVGPVGLPHWAVSNVQVGLDDVCCCINASHADDEKQHKLRSHCTVCKQGLICGNALQEPMREEASGLAGNNRRSSSRSCLVHLRLCYNFTVLCLNRVTVVDSFLSGSRQFSPAVNILKGFLQQCLPALLSVPVVMFLTSTSCSQLADNGCQVTSNCKLLATVHVSSISFCLSTFSLIRSRQADL